MAAFAVRALPSVVAVPSTTPSTAHPAARPDLRALSLSQLHQLAQQGSRRARAELERRMRVAAVDEIPPTPKAAISTPTPMPRSRAQSQRARPPTPPLLTDRVPLDSTAPAPPQALIDQWALIERQALERSRASGPPRLVGLVLIGWAVVLGLGGLVLLAQGGSAYYLLCALGSAAVGWLLMQRSRWAYAVHGLLLLAALAWATLGGSLALALVQAAPVWIAALWMAVAPVRDGLD